MFVKKFCSASPHKISSGSGRAVSVSAWGGVFVCNGRVVFVCSGRVVFVCSGRVVFVSAFKSGLHCAVAALGSRSSCPPPREPPRFSKIIFKPDTRFSKKIKTKP
ncbi:hypothetical protein [Methanimicrococcus hongohii]|uniref:hypothetical protein n=1 Tax=Methanimicrococcus hongohii TaxID=3028295 RepID=UPI00292FDFBB|nr:hypothetical protein [Methanimicrococcus sp. Hf6]